MPMRDSLNAFLDLPEVAAANGQSGPLAGLTLAVKDIFDVAGLASGWGNPTHAAEAEPASKTAPAVRILLDAGARFLGKTQTEELAFSMIGQNVHFPHPVNPRAPDRITGGSSSGSAAAVAGGLADIATGSDTGGSIRAPASFCGLIGLRTTHGRVSLEGAMPLSPSFDTFGWFAKDIRTYRKVAEVLLGEADARQPARPGKGERKRIRLISIPSLDALVTGAAETAEYRRMKDIVSEILGPPATASFTPDIEALYWCVRKLQAYEAWASHGDWISSGDRGLGQMVHDRFAYGMTVTVADVRVETARRQAFREALRDILGGDGFIVMPTVPCAAPRSDSTPEGFAAFREQAIRMLCWSGLSGFPQITLPIGAVDGAPFGISLMGPPDSDMALIDLGQTVLEKGSEANQWTP